MGLLTRKARENDTHALEQLIDAAQEFAHANADRLEQLEEERRWRACLGAVIAGTLDLSGDEDLIPDLGPADTTPLELEELAQAYPLALGFRLGEDNQVIPSPESRKSSGSYYTPKALAQRLAELAIPQRAGNPLVLDPACGSGNLLLAACDRLMSKDKAHHRLFGLDTDPNAVLLARHRLRGNLGLPPAEQIPYVRVGDALTEQALWKEAVEGFDAILANPPFGNVIESMVPDTYRSMRKARFPELGGTADLAYYFTSLSIRLLREGGRLAILQPRAFVSTAATNGLRTGAVSGISLFNVEETAQHDLFGGAAVFVCMAVFGRSHSTPFAVAAVPESKEAFEISASMTVSEAYSAKALLQDGSKAGLRLLTTGLIDPGEVHWGRRKCRFLGVDYREPVLPTVSLPTNLGSRATKALRPKILVAGLSSRIEAFLDLEASYIGSVSTYTITHPDDDREELSRLQSWLCSQAATEKFRKSLGSTALGGGNITLTKPFLKALVAELP